MLKALIKKELSQLGNVYFRNRKTGKPRSKGATIGIILLMAFVFLSFGMMFGGTAYTLASSLVPAGRSDFFFAVIGLFTIAFGVIGSVFTTHAILYNAKDNEFLLAMPIEPFKILLSRMISVYIMNFLFCAVVWVPAEVVYCSVAGVSYSQIALSVMLLFAAALFVTVLTCVLGWLVALVTSRIRNKSIATVLFSLLFIGAYYYVYFRINNLLNSILANSDKIEAGLRGWGMPIWKLGAGAAGDHLSALIFILISLALFGITLFVLSRSLIRLLTVKKGAKRAVYREKRGRQGTVSAALVKKELSRFAASPTYILNCGIGIIFLIAAAVAMLIKGDLIREVLDGILLRIGIPSLAPLLVLAVILFISSMFYITAPSVSLEGKNLWILQSSPVEPRSVLSAKIRTHLLLALPPVALCAAAICIALRIEWTAAVLTVCCSLFFVWLIAEWGLMMNVLKPNFDWSNEAVPIKQDLPVLFTFLFGWLMTVVFCAIGFLMLNLLGIEIALGVIIVLEIAVCLLIHAWNMRAGARRFAEM